MSWPKAMPVVEVEWIDSSADTGWAPATGSKAEDHDLGCSTAGYLVRKTRDRIVVALSQAAGGCIADTIHIPRSAIRQMTVLKPAAQRGHRKAD